jgi:hypothetical protein
MNAFDMEFLIRRVVIVLLSIWLVLASFVPAASATPQQASGSLTGRVEDSDGKAVSGAKIELISEAGDVIASTISDESGRYVFGAISFGKYLLRASFSSFAVYSMQVDIRPGQSARADIQFKLGHSTKTVTVAADGSTPIPIYNAIFSPTGRSEATHLLEGERTLLRFFIGPHDSKNALNLPLWTVNPKILKETGNLPLTITMTCLLCADQSVQSQIITFSGSRGESSEAHFYFVPGRASMKEDSVVTKILVDVFSKGIQYDHLSVDVVVDKVNASTVKQKEQRVAMDEFSPTVPQGPSTGPDLILTVRPQFQGPIELQLEPIHPELKSCFNGLQYGTGKNEKGQLRWFQTGDLTNEEMDTIESKAALTLRGVTDRNNLALQQVIDRSPSGAVNLDSNDLVTLSSTDKDNVLNDFFSIGSYFYYRLFMNGEQGLRDLTSKLESFTFSDGHALRLLIRTKGISFPWQLLHVPGQPTAEGFWGFRYEITVDSLIRTYGGSLPTILVPGQSDVSVFGVYKAGDGESPVVSVLANQQADYFKTKMQLQQALTVDSSLTFLQNLKQHSSYLDFVFVYAHGSSGVIVQTTPDGHNVVQHEAEGPRLIFSQTEYVGPIDLKQLAVQTDGGDTPFFGRQPIVLLNACETGTSAISTGAGLTLPIALLQLGARGVVATESPVSNIFALRFGNALIDEIVQGHEMSASLLKVRRKFLDLGNPFGLLYSYYGNSGANVSYAGKANSQLQMDMKPDRVLRQQPSHH